jgi:HSP20 family protein
VDIFDVGDSLLVVAELPGVKDDQVRVCVERGSLIISGYRAKTVPEKTRHVHQMEIPHGAFQRVLSLPEEIDVLCITAEYKEGYLVIRIPRETGHE